MTPQEKLIVAVAKAASARRAWTVETCDVAIRAELNGGTWYWTADVSGYHGRGETMEGALWALETNIKMEAP